MADTDLRDALARRLQKSTGDSSPSVKGSAPIPVNAVRGLPPLPRGGNNPVIYNSQESGGNRVDGFLYKYSSGPISRWQKRYFILENCKLNYYKRVPVDPSSAQPNKTFSIRRIKQVKVPNEEELDFSLVFSNNKSYSMRAPSMDEMRRWIGALRSAIELSEKLALDNPNASIDDGDGMSDNDGMTSANGSVFSDSSPKNLAMSPSSKTIDETASGTGGRFSHMIHGLIPKREMLSLHRSHPSTDSDPAPTVPPHVPWSVDIEQLGLDKNFEEWFYFVPNSIPSPRSAPGSPRRRSSVPVIREIRMTHVIDGCTRASNHMWCVFAGLPRGTDMRLEEAIGKAKHRIHGPLALGNANTLVEEYVSRIVKYVGLSLDVRFASSHHNVAELPSLMECIAKFITAVDRLIPLHESQCVCCYCDPSGSGLLKLEKSQNRKSVSPPPVCCSNEKWRKNFRSLLQRLGGELEVGLIEELQQITSSAESVWNMPPIEPGSATSRHNSMGHEQAAHGPSLISHPLLDDLVAKSQNVTVSSLMTSFSVSLVQAAQSKCLNASHQWMAAYPLAARLVAEHSSSALVAAMNSVCRQFKRNCMSVSQIASEECDRKLTDAAKHNRIDKWRKISATWNASGTSQFVQAVASVKSSKLSSTEEQQSAVGTKPKQEVTLFTSIEHLVAFINECVLISRFCAKTWSNGVSSKFTPAVFLTCMDGLSGAFLSSAVDASLSLVKLHLHPITRSELSRLFGPKVLTKSTTSPMTTCKETTEGFFAAITSLRPLPCVKEAVTQLVSQYIAHDYLTGLIKNRPKLKTFKTLPELIVHDTEIYRDFCGREYGVTKNVLDTNLGPIDKVVEMLNETNACNFTIHLNTVSKILGSNSAAFAVISGVLKMKEHEFASSSKLKKDVASMVSSMKQQVAQGEDSTGACCGELDDESTTVDASSVETSNAKRGKTNSNVKLNVNQVKIVWDFDE